MTAAQKQQLDEQGYVVLPDLMDADFVSAARRRVDELYEQEGDASGTPKQTAGECGEQGRSLPEGNQHS